MAPKLNDFFNFFSDAWLAMIDREAPVEEFVDFVFENAAGAEDMEEAFAYYFGVVWGEIREGLPARDQPGQPVSKASSSSTLPWRPLQAQPHEIVSMANRVQQGQQGQHTAGAAGIQHGQQGQQQGQQGQQGQEDTAGPAGPAGIQLGQQSQDADTEESEEAEEPEEEYDPFTTPSTWRKSKKFEGVDGGKKRWRKRVRGKNKQKRDKKEKRKEE